MRTPDRFVPVRAGIVNLYEYDDQTFELADGRLLLRGHNTSGKTKALELLFPFCLDGDISPRKLDPFAKNAKEMKWNLVGCVDHEQRIGYVWTEFARLGVNGLEHVTGGVGMKAHRGRDGVQRWYFLLRGRRIGYDLSLRRGDYPLTRRELVDELAADDVLVDAPRDYRRLLNEAVFGFSSIDQYETMLTLLLELRRPHLSKELKPGDVAALLTGALPEVDHELMRRVGEGLEQLDDLQAALRTVELVRERVEQFTRSSYRSYARAAIGDRATRLRVAAREHSKAAEARRAAADELAKAHERAQLQLDALETTRRALDVAEGERDALLQSPEWASVAEIEALGRAAGHARVAAKQACERTEDAAARIAADEGDAITAAATADTDRAALRETLAGLSADAREAGLDASHELLAPGLEDRDRSAKVAGLLGAEADGLLEALAEHDRLLDAVTASQQRFDRACEERELASEALRLAGDARAGAEHEVADAREALVEAIEVWAAELLELRLDEATLARTLELEESVAPQETWRHALDERRDLLVAERSRLSVARERLALDRATLEDERAAVAAERDSAPPAARTRTADRAARPGAPLWQLVEFAPSLDVAEQAGIEAALESAGLLDAWVTPDGVVSDTESLDVLLDAGCPSAAGATLAEALVADRDGPVAAAVVERILTSIALVDSRHELAGHACAVSRDGDFRFGPAQGRFAKPEAEYVGASARVARRTRRLAELDARIEAQAERERAAEEAEAVLEGRLAALIADAERFPDLQPLESARRALASAALREAEARRVFARRESETAAAAEQRREAIAVVATHAASCRLPVELDTVGIRDRTVAACRYRAALPAAVAALGRSSASIRRLTELERRLQEARDAAADLVLAHALADSEARRLEAEHAEREATLGSTADEARSRMRGVEERLSWLRGERGRLETARTASAVEVQERKGACTSADRDLQLATDEREAALGTFRRLEASDMFVLALGSDAPGDHAQAEAWTLSRALDILRAIPPEQLAVRASLVSLANQVQQRCGELDRGLGQLADMAVMPESDPDGLLVVRVRRGPALVTLGDLRASLDEEIAERERALSAEQRRVFGDALLDEIAEHLRGRIERVTGLVADMNTTLAGCETAAGKTVQLEWAPREDDELRTVARLLRRSVATLGEAEREPLIAFFRERIQQAREQAAPDAGASVGLGATAHLRMAFDYRSWFDFTLYEAQGGQRVKLTAKRHAVGSGGEQAVLIHMPLLASAAALYASSRDGRAPRLVILDEALSGIDDQTRERVFAVLVALDLDVVMTSHELWGTYRTVPSLSIYQLHRENGVFGVASEHFLWDGETLRELEQTALLP